MEPDLNSSKSSRQLLRLADALGEMRDSWVAISLALTDLVTEMPSAERDEVRTAVERYLSLLQEGGRKTFD